MRLGYRTRRGPWKIFHLPTGKNGGVNSSRNEQDGRVSARSASSSGTPDNKSGVLPDREVKLLPNKVVITESKWSVAEGRLIRVTREEPYRTFAYRPLFPSANPFRDIIWSSKNSLCQTCVLSPGAAPFVPWRSWFTRRRGSLRTRYVLQPA